MTSKDIRSQPFEIVRKGYNPDAVDDYLMQVAKAMERVENDLYTAITERDQYLEQRDALLADKEDLQAKLYVLAGKVEEYRGHEDSLKTVLINAQRMGETVVHEAKQKAEQILRDATGQSELLRQRAEEETRRECATLENLQGEVKTFKTTILNLYKQHIESLSALDAPMQHASEVLSDMRPQQKEDVENVVADQDEMSDASMVQQAPASLPMQESPIETFPKADPFSGVDSFQVDDNANLQNDPLEASAKDVEDLFAEPKMDDQFSFEAKQNKDENPFAGFDNDQKGIFDGDLFGSEIPQDK